MGFFSWKTSDTKKSIANQHSGRKTFTVHMITENGLVYTEPSYDGYGKFGDKDIYTLIAEMNNLEFDKNDEDDARLAAINLLFRTELTNGERTYVAGGKDFFNWETPLKQEGGKTPNQLIQEGWMQVHPNGYGDWDKAAKNGIKIPKLVQKLPNKENWKEAWDKLPYPENCDSQGFFY